MTHPSRGGFPVASFIATRLDRRHVASVLRQIALPIFDEDIHEECRTGLVVARADEPAEYFMAAARLLRWAACCYDNGAPVLVRTAALGEAQLQALSLSRASPALKVLRDLAGMAGLHERRPRTGALDVETKRFLVGVPSHLMASYSPTMRNKLWALRQRSNQPSST